MVCAGDCDDSEPATYPGALELCDGDDNDCSGGPGADEVDLDEDTYMVCAGDCDDSEPATYPGAPELCDGIDNDCVGGPEADEVDLDGDAFMICDGDCDDSEPMVNPGIMEVCDNGADDDCDGITDQDDSDCIGASPRLLAAAFEGEGLSIYADEIWEEISPDIPLNLLVGNLTGYEGLEVVADFGEGIGVSLYSQTEGWSDISAWTAENMVLGDLDGDCYDEIVIDFGDDGLYLWDDDTGLNALAPGINVGDTVFANVDEDEAWELIIDIPPYALICYDHPGSLTSVGPSPVIPVVPVDEDGDGADELLIDTGTYLVLIDVNDGGYRGIAPGNTDQVVAVDLDGDGQEGLAIDFGSTYGLLMYYEGGSFDPLFSGDVDLLFAADMAADGSEALIISRTGDPGLFAYDSTGWNPLSALAAEAASPADLDGEGGEDVVVDFGTDGLSLYSQGGSWTTLSSADALIFAAGDPMECEGGE